LEAPGLSVKECAVAAIKLPVANYREFLRLSCLPIALTVPLQLLSVYIWYHVSKRPIISTLINAPQVVIDIPFAVAWIRLSINGPGSVARRSLFPFGRVERNFLFAELTMGFAISTLIGAGVGAIVVALQTSHAQRVILTAAFMLLGIMLIAAGFLVVARLPLIVVMVALQRYAGLRACWRLSRGVGLRTIGIVVLATLPFSIGMAIGGAIQSFTANSIWCVLPATVYIFFEFLERAASFGALAIIYKFQTESLQPKPEQAALS
jgi:hypothetical protein